MLFIVIAVVILSALLFRKAAGTLRLDRINIISYTFYLFLLQTLIGIVLINMGYTEHYTFNYLVHDRNSILLLVTCVVCFTAVVWPLTMLLTERAFGVNAKEKYKEYCETEVKKTEGSWQFNVCLMGTVVCMFCLVWYLAKIGYIPLLKLLHIGSPIDFVMERARVGTVYILHPVFTNIFVLTAIPLLSYLTFSFALVYREKKWFILTVVLFAGALITKTYKFAKAPIVFHLLIYILIFSSIKKISRTVIYALYGLLGGVMVIMYQLVSGSMGLTDIYNGILGRTFFSQVGTLSYVFDAFPRILPYLKGRSLAPIILRILGINPDLHVRSAKIMMDYYWPDKVYDGGAGVLNSLFVGESYANFGWTGLVLGIIWVGFICGILFVIMIKAEKNAVQVAAQITIASQIASTTQGGFFDFVYSVGLIILVLFFVFFYYLPRFEKKWKNRIGPGNS